MKFSLNANLHGIVNYGHAFLVDGFQFMEIHRNTFSCYYEVSETEMNGRIPSEQTDGQIVISDTLHLN